MNLSPRIEHSEERLLVGMTSRMSVLNMPIMELWQSFGPRQKEIVKGVDDDLYSAEVYPNLEYFSDFQMSKEFDKWAAKRVSDVSDIPDGMEVLVIPEGKYAVFTYKGKASNVGSFYQAIYNDFLPKSEYQLDDRPHFAVMGEKYIHDHEDSEEDLWVPIV